MKKLAIVLFIALGLSSAPARAAGPYDGIWLVTYSGTFVGYYSAHEQNGTLIAVSLGGDFYWEAFIGPRAGNTLTLSTLVSGVAAQAHVIFTSDTTFTATQTSCVPQVPGWYCKLPNGATVQGTKVW